MLKPRGGNRRGRRPAPDPLSARRLEAGEERVEPELEAAVEIGEAHCPRDPGEVGREVGGEGAAPGQLPFIGSRGARGYWERPRLAVFDSSRNVAEVAKPYTRCALRSFPRVEAEYFHIGL